MALCKYMLFGLLLPIGHIGERRSPCCCNHCFDPTDQGHVLAAGFRSAAETNGSQGGSRV
jgi:hypothetical protein